MKKIIEFLVNRSLFGNVTTVGLLIAGIITMLSMRREAFPMATKDSRLVMTYRGGSLRFWQSCWEGNDETEKKS